jgi:predicted ATPase
VPLMIGHRLMGTSSLCTGNIEEGRAHYDQAVALYNPAEHRQLSARFGQDVRMAILSYRALALWALGYQEAALVDSNQAISSAREIDEAGTLLYALGHATLIQVFRGNYAAANAIINELVDLADKKSALIWKAEGVLHQGWVYALTGKASDAVNTLTPGIALWRSTGATLWLPLYLPHLALTCLEVGQVDVARSYIVEAMEAIQTSKERWYEAEVHRADGEFALRSPQSDTAKAEACFERALAIARQQRARSWELRAAMSVARLWRDQGKPQQARELLAPVYGWFTEGFDTRDLKEAKALLGTLAL